MKRFLLLMALASQVWAAPLTLEETLATADAPHPELRLAQADAQALDAERLWAESQRDFNLSLDLALRAGDNPASQGWKADHAARLNLRRPLWDGGRFEAGVAAGRKDSAAAQQQLLEVRARRRVELMNRFFDVLLTDMEYAMTNEYMAVAYVRWDNGKDRQALGELSQPALLELEARFQEWRVRRMDAERRARDRRSALALAMGRPGELAAELAEPRLTGNDRALPGFEALLAALKRHNPRLAALRLQLDAARERSRAVRLTDQPRLDLEAALSQYSRDTSTRDTVSGGVSLTWPLQTGSRLDAESRRALARVQRIEAELAQSDDALRQTLYELWQEIQFLREVERNRARIDITQRDWALERARAEYEMELKTNLGNAMADTQRAKLAERSVEYRLALAFARLDTLLGVPLETVQQVKDLGK
jgi:outer membrane protein TolC